MPYELPFDLSDLEPEQIVGSPTRRMSAFYRSDDKLRLAAAVAYTTGRPLLLRGEPGSGKSSFAAYLARNLRYRFHRFVVTSRTEARDLLYRYDAIRRLADAHARKSKRVRRAGNYITPGPLWWILDPTSAREVDERAGGVPGEVLHDSEAEGELLLIDEIDKADAEVPNDLLEPLERRAAFTVPELGRRIEPAETGPIFVVITTNAERALPGAFVRRCISHRLGSPGRDALVAIARGHIERASLGAVAEGRGAGGEMLGTLADKLIELRRAARLHDRRPPGIAEYLDAVSACLSLGIEAGEDAWEWLLSVTLSKSREADDP